MHNKIFVLEDKLLNEREEFKTLYKKLKTQNEFLSDNKNNNININTDILDIDIINKIHEDKLRSMQMEIDTHKLIMKNLNIVERDKISKNLEDKLSVKEMEIDRLKKKFRK